MEYYNDFYKLADTYLSNINNTFINLEKDIIDKINLYINELSKNNEKNYKSFSTLISTVQEEKKMIEKVKKRYFETAKDIVEQEAKIAKNESNPKIKPEEKQKELDILNKLKNINSTESQKYKTEIDKMNNVLQEQESNYEHLKKQIVSDYEKHLKTSQTFFSSFINILNENSKYTKEFENKVNSTLNRINIRRDIKSFDLRFDYLTQTKTRFTKEEFLNYDLLRKTGETSNSSGPSSLIQTTVNQKPEIFNVEGFPNLDNEKQKYLCNMDINSVNPNKDEDEEILESLVEHDNKFSPIIEKLMTSNESITNDEFGIVTYEIDKKKNAAEKFLYCLLKFYTKPANSVQIQTLVNLHHLANIFLVIIEKTINKPEIFFLNFLLLYFSEKTYYINPENMFNKCYLCQLLSKNKVFKNKVFWMKLMKIKIGLLLDKAIKDEIERRENLNRDSKNVLFKMTNLFSNIRLKENKKIENEILYNQLCLEKQPLIAVKVVEDYIQHFANYNQEINDSIDIIVKCSIEYKFDREYVNYFNAELHSNLHTVTTKQAIMEGIENTVDYKSLYFMEKYCEDFKKLQPREILLAYGMKFLPLNDFPSLLTINKNVYDSLAKPVFKNILFKYNNMPIETRIKIWKNLINYHEISKKYNYQDTLSKIKEIKIDKDSPDIIDLDAMRTPFDSDQAENRIKIANILKCIRYTLPNITYSQGMNYIAAFILKMTKSEEEAFHFYLSLLISTDYGELFPNDLAKLKKYFYIFDRLLNVLMPETYFFLKNNKISVGCFISPWFITLFTITYQYIEKENPKVLLRIWDMFLFEGFNSIMKIGISCIKHYEHNLLKFKFENLLQFLMNDIVRSDYFSNNYYETLMFISVNFTIEEELFMSIENEFNIKYKINEKLLTESGNKDK